MSKEPSLDYILSSQCVRDRANQILEMSLKNQGEFIVHLDKLNHVADFVIGVIKEKYPDLKIPYHTRFNHFHVGGRDRVAELDKLLIDETPIERARCKVDLVVTSVLLDAGAGNDWSFTDTTGHLYSRSEGLAVASYNMFMNGAFSSDVNVKLRADGPGLIHVTEEHILKSFQVSVSNPLLGTKGRAELLHRLGKAVELKKEIFRGNKVSRPGHLVDYLLKKYPNKKISGEAILQTVLHGLGSIWPGRIVMNDENLGDTWRHPKLGEGAESFVPFHKLSQWLTYSLLDPLEELGFQVVNLNGLTGLAEYRNGGLMLDSGLIEARSNLLSRPHHPDSRIVIEWRALTVALLDKLAHVIQKKLNLSAEEFPLAKVLEGGTWWAGRKLAEEKRHGKPPFEIISDGTVF